MFRYSILIIVILCGFVATAPNCDQPPKREDFMDCCQRPGGMRDAKVMCAQKYPFNGKKMNLCFGECFFNETGLMVNGEIQRENVHKLISEVYKDSPERLPVIKDIVDKCMEKAKAKLSTMTIPEDDKCNPMPSLIMFCYYTESFINCPASMWQESERCTAAKEYLQVCKKDA